MKDFDITLDDVAGALAAIGEVDRETWVSLAMAIKSEFGDAGYLVWDQWSQGWGGYKAGAAKSTWRSIRQGGGVGIGTLIHEARAAGFEFQPGELTKEEKRARKAAVDKRRRELEAIAEKDEEERRAWHERVAALSEELDRLLSGMGASPYLDRKRVRGFGLSYLESALLIITHIEEGRIELVTERAKISRFFDANKAGQVDRAATSFKYMKRGTTGVPMRDAGGKIWGWQFIYPGKKKTFLKFSKKQGLFHLIKPADEAASKQRTAIAGHLMSPEPEVIAVAEGYATAASIHQATGWPVAVAFDAGNIASVAQALQGVYPGSRLVICGDDDRETKGNPGRTKATEAARKVGGVAVFPDFSEVEQGAVT